jgi:hypothetical protein
MGAIFSFFRIVAVWIGLIFLNFLLFPVVFVLWLVDRGSEKPRSKKPADHHEKSGGSSENS